MERLGTRLPIHYDCQAHTIAVQGLACVHTELLSEQRLYAGYGCVVARPGKKHPICSHILLLYPSLDYDYQPHNLCISYAALSFVKVFGLGLMQWIFCAINASSWMFLCHLWQLKHSWSRYSSGGI